MKLYPLSAFVIDEPKFKKLYLEYVNLSDKPIKYLEWLIKNNFGILQDTHFSIMQRALHELKRPGNKNKFINIVRRGDILLTNGDNSMGLIGLAAIMVTDNFVLEMPGHEKNKTKMLYRGISNNRRIMKQIWFDKYRHHWINIYRYPDSAVADAAARWAYRNYYNPTGGSVKTIHTKHVTYKISTNFTSTNYSYCSKLVLQAYHYGNPEKNVIDTRTLIPLFPFDILVAIVPNKIPSYFTNKYALQRIYAGKH
ncbi:uncharacterized protein LOC113235303 [Hyposmocoma kahamanoa]|uniref:uncharacterized protein LOC113235303 n=1 Tax=Hyposmocoma kahamanoa TaxID=1477025 RepID=UPI000E6D5E97|nr:uncharacterized protein LOC113235303 [Hyposmocoma kahamanoa]